MEPEPSPRDLLDAVVDLQRIVTRQSQPSDAARPRAEVDIPLLVELHALHHDATTLAETARTKRERTGFETMASAIERLLAGRGGRLVRPVPDDAFDPATMEASEVVAAETPEQDRTVESVLAAGLVLADGRRSIRPARVVVRRA